MRHGKVVKKLDRNRGGRKALFRQLEINLITVGKIRTTIAKAKAMRPKIEHLITKAKTGTPAAERFVQAELNNPVAVKKLMKEIAPSFAKRSGGYTRITKVSARRGDGADMGVIEFVK
ncbi:MAG: 50S ribosomal protein L17 [uncultured bacterium]|nr:MAG: 50S ribosomal protein L17 [uncultured bacterium]